MDTVHKIINVKYLKPGDLIKYNWRSSTSAFVLSVSIEEHAKIMMLYNGEVQTLQWHQSCYVIILSPVSKVF